MKQFLRRFIGRFIKGYQEGPSQPNEKDLWIREEIRKDRIRKQRKVEFDNYMDAVRIKGPGTREYEILNQAWKTRDLALQRELGENPYLEHIK